MNHIEATEEFIRNYFKDSIFVLVAGSVIRGEATITSDLDIFIIKNDIHKAYRESFFESDWPIEAFIHTQDSYKDYFMGDIKRRRPSLPQMCSEGIVIRDTMGLTSEIKDLANGLLVNGPTPRQEEYQ